MPSQKHFFATSKDLNEAFARAEAFVPVHYVSGLLSDTPDQHECRSLTTWTDLGVCKNESPPSGGFFWVFPAHVKARVRKIEMSAGNTCYKPHVSDNPDAMLLEPGGVFSAQKDEVKLIVGKIATTATCSGEAEMLFKRFSSAFLRGFKRAAGAHCGPEALKLIAGGAKTGW